ncbi:Membrane transport protein [Dillenia turbinata]|uniref:Membrane transport protein n=1 Tax=Dillenia turbinata TaxID=194707 RepID=A0AAN8UHH8_9MAGN
MIGLGDVYTVVVAMAPLYFALFLGYGSVKWWHIFTKEQCDIINRFVCYFTLPLFTLQFTAQMDPYNLNYGFIGADVIAKVVIVAVLAVWAKFSKNGSFRWFITTFALCSLNNSLAMGIPIMEAMYGKAGTDLVVQSSTVQTLLWLKILILVLEVHRFKTSVSPNELEKHESDIEENAVVSIDSSSKPSLRELMKVVLLKLVVHPTTYPCVLGIAWALISKRWNVKMPSIVEGCILVLSTAGTGTSMFSLGIFMTTQEKTVACGVKLTLLGLILRFAAGPAAMTIGAFAMGLHGTVLCMTIVQAALPQAIASFVYAKDYGLHPACDNRHNSLAPSADSILCSCRVP